MSTSPLHATVTLVDAALRFYQDDPEISRQLDGLRRRLREPLRVAISGMVKAGKSTLLNALVGEQIAPTDAGECTRVITWYRYSDHPTVLACPYVGEPFSLPIKRHDGRLVFELDPDESLQLERLEVGWPASLLRSVTLIDTPGIASVSQATSKRTTSFLIPEGSAGSTDAIVYLTRHMHASDLKFLSSFRDVAAGRSTTVNAIAVLSRADEIGAGRIDSILAAKRVAARYETNGQLAALALGVVPVAGLLAEGARTLREHEFRWFKQVADLSRDERELLLISTDRFVRQDGGLAITRQERQALLDRFGIFGIRLASSLIRSGVQDSSALAKQLCMQSGLNEVVGVIQTQFQSRSDALKVRSTLDSLETLLPREFEERAEHFHSEIERIRMSSHELRELSLLARLRTGTVPLNDARRKQAEQIVGGSGQVPQLRLGVSPSATESQVLQEAITQLDDWRASSQSPLMERPGVEACRIVIRSLEQIISDLSRQRSSVVVDSSDVVATSRPGETSARAAAEQGEKD